SVWGGTVAGRVDRTYDNNFRVAHSTVNRASDVAFVYDDDGLLTQAGDLVVTPDPQFGLVRATSIGGVAGTRGYNEFGDLRNYAAKAGGTPVLDEVYTPDDLGRIARKVETIGGVTTQFDYTYDLAGRLWIVQKNGVETARYEYDDNGNRRQKITP